MIIIAAPRCSMRGYGNGVVTPTHHRSSTPDAIIDMKETLAQSGSDTNPCKVKVVVRTNGDVRKSALMLCCFILKFVSRSVL